MGGCADVGSGLLDVVLDRVEEGALVDDERGEVLEELGERGDGLCDLGQLAVAAAQIHWVGRQEILREGAAARLGSKA